MFTSEGTFPDPRLDAEKAFEIFFKQNFGPLCAYCRFKFDFTPETCKEIVHAAFIKLWENREGLFPGPAVRSYLYKIITNNGIDMLRHEKIRQKYQADVQRSSSGNTAIQFDETGTKELVERIDKAVGALPDQMRKIFELSRYEGLKYMAIAEHLDISVKTVETQMSRALARLRESLSDYLLVVIMAVLVTFLN